MYFAIKIYKNFSDFFEVFIMPDKIKFFTVDFRDNFAYIGDKKFPVGSFVINFLNQFYEDDSAARVGSMTVYNYLLTKSMESGYIDEKNFLGAGEEILYILNVLPRFMPYNFLDVEGEKNIIKDMFTKENASYLMKYYTERGKFSLKDEGYHFFNVKPDGYDVFCKEATQFADTVLYTLKFYDSFSRDFSKAHDKFKKFLRGLDNVEHYNESGLLEYAHSIFGVDRFNLDAEYVAIPKNNKNNDMMLAKRLHFSNFYSFIITDFFEGLHYGHYPRQCEVCKKYFLMESARKQKYCTGFAPLELTGGEKITCRKFAAKNKQKELAENDPIVDIYSRRCSCIRAEQSKNKIDKEFADKAKEIAKDLMYKFRREDGYTLEMFKRDMKKNNLYKMVEEEI